MTKERKYGFWRVEESKGEGVGLKALTPIDKIKQFAKDDWVFKVDLMLDDFKELKEYTYQELEDVKQEIRELRIKIDEVADQVC